MNILKRNCIIAASILIACACTKTPDETFSPIILLKQGAGLTVNDQSVPTGGRLSFGIQASGGGASITNLTVTRTTGSVKTIMMDKGIFVPVGGLDTTLLYNKSNDGSETWRFFIMNSNRDTASVSLRVLQGEGSAYGDINYYPSILIGYQGNTVHPNFIDLKNGTGYSGSDVSGFESVVDLAVIWYITSGKSSPTLSGPSYSSITGYYPAISAWPVRNPTLFDYKTSDNNLISIEQFESAQNDSLLVSGFKPDFTSGWCKYALTGKVIPFKTSGGKHGLLRVVRADENQSGSMEIAVKVQK
jgi:hypothetical protein